MITNAQLIDGYAQMVTDRVASGWKPYLLTFMFDPIGGSPRRVSDVMEKEVERVRAFSFTSSASDAAFHSSAETIGGFCIAVGWFVIVLLLCSATMPSSLDTALFPGREPG